MTKKEAEILIEKYLAGQCSPQEKDLLDKAYALTTDPGSVEMDEADIDAHKKAVLSRILPASSPIRKLQPYISIAAAVLLAVIVTGIYLYYSRPAANDITPGGNYATLTLVNGQTIRLDSAQSGIIIGAEDITYSNGNLVKNVILSEGRGEAPRGTEGSLPTSLTLTTPKGGQYQIILSDGTKVWLNAASTLKYPSRFSGNQRKVFLDGEGYFEIKDDKAHPFQVQTGKQTIEVVGTHFNVNSYDDEPMEATTLLEGAVKVTSGTQTKLLQPGQEATIHNGVQVTEADMKSAMAWKNGKFVFNDESLESIMRKVARWYNVEIDYNGADKNLTYWGSFSRYDKVSHVLRKLELAGNVHFTIAGRRITATK